MEDVGMEDVGVRTDAVKFAIDVDGTGCVSVEAIVKSAETIYKFLTKGKEEKVERN